MDKGEIDLHIHTIYSDGEYTPEEIYQLVRKNNLKIFSITDHDTIEGARQMSSKGGINYIPGIELTAKTNIGREHILGYGIDLNNSNLNKVLREKKQYDIDNFLLYYEKLVHEFGIIFPTEDIDLLIKKVGNIGRVDLSNLLRKYGYTSSQDESFDKFLNPIKDMIKMNKKGLTEEECISLIKESGGYASLAHPISLNPEFKNAKDLANVYEELKKRLIIMKSFGLDAIEVQHIHQNNPFRKMLHCLAYELSLLESGGTDFHGEEIKPGVVIGSGYQNNVIIKELSLIDEIKRIRLKNVV